MSAEGETTTAALETLTLMTQAAGFRVLFAETFDRMATLQADGPMPSFKDEGDRAYILCHLERHIDASSGETTYATFWRREEERQKALKRTISLRVHSKPYLSFSSEIVFENGSGWYAAGAERNLVVFEDSPQSHESINKELKLLLTSLPIRDRMHIGAARINLVGMNAGSKIF